MKNYFLPVSILLALTACQKPASDIVVPTSGQVMSEISWLGGCWQTADGATREEWIIADADHAFAINYTLKDNRLVFHEHARIDKNDNSWAFNAYPNGIGPSAFPVEKKSKTSITFVNVLHDYPQIIKYSRKGSDLTAKISKLDGTEPFTWAFIPCR